MNTLLLLLCAIAAVTAEDAHLTPTFIARLNAIPNATWTASENQGTFFRGATTAQIKRLMGVIPGPDLLPEKTFPSVPPFALPSDFDSAVNWPHCATITTIRDQGNCGSCWAVAAAEAMSDRYCTASANPKNVSISANDIMSCCKLLLSCMGCTGGQPQAAWGWWKSDGLVDEGCDPYPFPKCEHFITGQYPPCPKDDYPTPKCVKSCNNSESWSGALRKGTKSYSLSGESAYQQEIFTNGPIEVGFSVYDDFPAYKTGVYSNSGGKLLGGHAVKITGWGTMNGTPYWRVANSWNTDWGDKGWFLIKRGNNECGIEKSGQAGMP